MTRSDARKRITEQHTSPVLPAPDCPRGYTTSQLDQIIGDQMPAFRSECSTCACMFHKPHIKWANKPFMCSEPEEKP